MNPPFECPRKKIRFGSTAQPWPDRADDVGEIGLVGGRRLDRSRSTRRSRSRTGFHCGPWSRQDRRENATSLRRGAETEVGLVLASGRPVAVQHDQERRRPPGIEDVSGTFTVTGRPSTTSPRSPGPEPGDPESPAAGDRSTDGRPVPSHPSRPRRSRPAGPGSCADHVRASPLGRRGREPIAPAGPPALESHSMSHLVETPIMNPAPRLRETFATGESAAAASSTLWQWAGTRFVD